MTSIDEEKKQPLKDFHDSLSGKFVQSTRFNDEDDVDEHTKYCTLRQKSLIKIGLCKMMDKLKANVKINVNLIKYNDSAPLGNVI